MFDWPFFIFYMLLFLLTWWLYFGYLIVIFLHSYFESETEQKRDNSSSNQSIALLIPLRNEEAMIEEKIQNIISLNYPKENLEVFLIDGKSTDSTVMRINKYLKKYPYFHLIKAQKSGKIQQLNEVLPTITSDIIVCADADGDLDKNTLQVISSCLADEKVGLVGVKTIPKSFIPEETYFWEQQNRVRLAESRYHSPLYVIAVCYGFKKGLITIFPEDVIADDIYLSFLAIKKGFKTVYTDQTTAVELRCPSNFTALFQHKVRKTNAFIHEIFRFFPTFLIAPLRWQVIFYTHSLQVLMGPFLLFSLGIILIYVSLTSLTGILPFLTISSLILAYVLIRPASLSGIFKKIRMFLFMHLVLIYTLLTYPFYRQTSNYKKTS